MTDRKADSQFSTEIVHRFSTLHLSAVLKLEQACFPESWRYPDAEEYYSEMLRDEKNIHVFLKHDEDRIGYAFGRPLSSVLAELRKEDPELLEVTNTVYIETIQIDPLFQGKGGAGMLLFEVNRESARRGAERLAIHARKANAFNGKIKALFHESIKVVRDIDHWAWADSEPYQYLEWELPVKSTPQSTGEAQKA